MKKIFIVLVAVMVAMSAFSMVSYAGGHGRRDRGHDQAWRRHHQQVWKAHEREWRRYDREWAAHRGDRHWREAHIRMWPEWYRWHRDNESFLSIRISADSHGGPFLDLDFRN